MKIEHVALWVSDLDALRNFYERNFSATSNALYKSAHRPFLSYFLSFPSGARLELMQSPDHMAVPGAGIRGYAHIAISVGSRKAVDELTEQLRANGVRISGEPRMTGDGYYESTVLDPENNVIEICV